MAKPVEERVKEIIVRAARSRGDEVFAGREVHRGPRGRLPRHRRAGDGLRGRVRSRDPGRGRREDHHRRGRHQLHQGELSRRRGARRRRVDSAPSRHHRGWGRSRRSATPPRSSGPRSPRASRGIGPITRSTPRAPATPDRGRGQGLRPAPATSTRRTTASSTRSSSTRWPAAVMAVEDAGLNLERVDKTRFGILVGSGHRRHQHAAGEPQGAAREGAGPGLALLHPDADREHGLRPALDALRSQGPELLGGDRVRDRQPRDRRRDADHPARRRRRHDRGRRRGHHHPAHHRRASAR